MHIECSNVLTVPDPWEIGAITSPFINIDWVVMTQMGSRSDKELGVANLAN